MITLNAPRVLEAAGTTRRQPAPQGQRVVPRGSWCSRAEHATSVVEQSEFRAFATCRSNAGQAPRYHRLGTLGRPCDTRKVKRAGWAGRTAASFRRAPAAGSAFFGQLSDQVNRLRTTFSGHRSASFDMGPGHGGGRLYMGRSGNRDVIFGVDTDRDDPSGDREVIFHGQWRGQQ
jgi:hypothetical protein